MTVAKRLSFKASDPRISRSMTKIMASAREVLLARGPSAFNVDEVSTLSGASKMTIYRHWKNREELLLEAFRSLIPTRSRPTYLIVDDSLETLSNAIVAYGKEFAEASWSQIMPALLQYSKEKIESAEIWSSFAEARAEDLTQLILRCVEQGKIAEVDIDLSISQLMGPLAFRRYLSYEPLDATFCKALVASFAEANRPKSQL